MLQGIGGGGLAPVEQAILVVPFRRTNGQRPSRSIAWPLLPRGDRASVGRLDHRQFLLALGLLHQRADWAHISFPEQQAGDDPPAFKAEVAEAKRLGKLRVDYIGILLIALGFAFLEFVLDRGRIDDWFGSSLISSMFVAAIVCLVLAVWWELRVPDPVVELGLLRERNFAFANIFYFLFGFVLFGSTTMIPEILQSLYGYTATDAGLVLGPGAAVITVFGALRRHIDPKGKSKSSVADRLQLCCGFVIHAVLQRIYIADQLHPLCAGASLAGLWLRLFVCAGERTCLFLPASREEQ